MGDIIETPVIGDFSDRPCRQRRRCQIAAAVLKPLGPDAFHQRLAIAREQLIKVSGGQSHRLGHAVGFQRAVAQVVSQIVHDPLPVQRPKARGGCADFADCVAERGTQDMGQCAGQMVCLVLIERAGTGEHLIHKSREQMGCAIVARYRCGCQGISLWNGAAQGIGLQINGLGIDMVCPDGKRPGGINQEKIACFHFRGPPILHDERCTFALQCYQPACGAEEML